MNLRILLPTRILLDRPVDKVTAEAENGSFCLLPRHVDFATALVPGLLSYTSGEQEEFVAIDEGILVKKGAEVLVSVRDAMIGPDLGFLRLMVRERYEKLDEREKRARSALVRLEADFVRRFIELRE